MKIGLIGDYQESVTAHRAIPLALELAAEDLQVPVDFNWLHSEEIDVDSLNDYAALWCVPASPYKNTENVLSAIRFARMQNVPFLGTCGGYQHAALEYARNVLGYKEAENAEINPHTSMPLISGLSCKLYDEEAGVRLLEGSAISRIYGVETISEEYFCGFGVNREYLQIFADSDMMFSGFDEDGDPRTLEISQNTFFVGTAFQPERSALKGLTHPLISALLKSVDGA